MAYYLTKFGSVTFPLTMPITEMPTAPAMPGMVQTLGGGFDAWGSDQAPANFPVSLQYRVLVADATAATYVATVNALRALGRTRAYLYRQGQDGTIQRALARLAGISAMDSVETFNAIELAFDFEVWEHWGSSYAHGFVLDAGYFFDDGLTFDSLSTSTTLTTNPQTVVVANGGNLPVDDAIVTFTAGDAAITVITILCGSAVWEWTGTLAAGKSLIVDAGAWSVTNDSADAYAGFVFYPQHALAGILRLAPGNNSVIIWHTGGGTGSTVSFGFSDAWA
jgi:hypothetical protein